MRILSLRDDVAVVKAFANTSSGKRFDEIFPALFGITDLVLETFNTEGLSEVDVVFIALPSGEAMSIVQRLEGFPGRIIDLGGDFRLKSADLYERFYKRPHTAPGLLAEAVYGLPEINRALIADAHLVANPGCYPTAAILALLPALRNGIIEEKGIVINALSGVSGAGRSSSAELSFVEVNENARAYKVGSHQHIPEIESVLSAATDKSIQASFIPHLVPMNRGIYSTIHANLRNPIGRDEVLAFYAEAYDTEPFVRVTDRIPEIKDVAWTNFCDVSCVVQERTRQLILISVIDNLVKGAAGQAVQNMNIMFGLSEITGLRPHRGSSIKENDYVH